MVTRMLYDTSVNGSIAQHSNNRKLIMTYTPKPLDKHAPDPVLVAFLPVGVRVRVGLDGSRRVRVRDGG